MDLNGNRSLPPNQKVLEILQSAWEGERENVTYISKLVKLTKDPADKETLRLLNMDENKHVKYFAEIYKKLSDEIISQRIQIPQRPISWDLYTELEKFIYKCTENVEFYRRIYFGFSDPDIRDMLFEIITDEINMAIKMTHMCNKNKVFY